MWKWPKLLNISALCGSKTAVQSASSFQKPAIPPSMAPWSRTAFQNHARHAGLVKSNSRMKRNGGRYSLWHSTPG